MADTDPSNVAEAPKAHKASKGKRSSSAKTRKSSSTRAGLVFKPSQGRRALKGTGMRCGDRAAVYLAAVLEYVGAEVLELSGNAARDNKKRRIIPRHVTLAVKNDEELNGLFKGHMSYGGVAPYIHPVLIPRSSGKGKGKVEGGAQAGSKQ